MPNPVPLAYIAEQTLLIREPTSRTLAALRRLFAETELELTRTMEIHTREMIRESVAQGLGLTLMFEKECPPDARIRVVPIDSSSAALTTKGYLAVRSEHERIPLIRMALDVCKSMPTMNGFAARQ